VFRGLDRAVCVESLQAIAFWWGVGTYSVHQWRKALGVRQPTAGTTRLRREYFHEPWSEEARGKAHARNWDPARCEKISATLRGRVQPRHVIEAAAAARRGMRHSEETRRKMSESHRRRGTIVPGIQAWSPAEDELLKTMSVEEVVRQTGRTERAVSTRQNRLMKLNAKRLVHGIITETHEP